MSYLGRVTNKSSDIRRKEVSSSTSATHTLTWTAPNVESLIVTINGITQQNNYTVSGTTLTLDTALISTDVMQVVGINDIGTTITPAEGSVNTSQLANDAVATAKIQDDAVTADKLATGLANATHTGDVTGATALTIATDAVDIAMLSATGTASSSTFLRGDNSWTAVDTSGITSNKDDIALLAFKTQANGNLARYNLVDQSVDSFEDASGVDASASTGETRDATGKYYAGSTPAAYQYWRAVLENTPTASQHRYFEARVSDASGVIAGLGSGNQSTGAGAESLNQTYTDWNNTFDGNTGGASYFLDDNGCAATAWWQLDFGSGTEKSLTQMEFYMGSNSTNAQWAVQYDSTDTGGTGGTWVKVADLDPSATSQWNSVTFSAVTYTNMTLISNAQTAQSAPTTGDLVITYTDGAGTATINTDLKAYISRDGSAYTSAVTLVSQGTTGGHTILTANGVDLSGITSGTSMRWKIETLNQSVSKSTRIHAVSLGWS